MDYKLENGNLIISDGEKYISGFRDRLDIKSVTIPESVKIIDMCAFKNCSSLETVNYNAVDCSSYGISNIHHECRADTNPFVGCISLSTVNIGKGVEVIPAHAFIDTNLKRVTISDSVTTIKFHAFDGCRSLTSIEIPDSVTAIGCKAFANCTSLTNVTISNSVTSIEEGVFYNCSSLTSIKIPDSVTTIERQAFEDCKNLETVIIPNSVKNIEQYAFANCRSLESIIIPNSVKYINYCVFEDCVNLTSIIIPNSVKVIASSTFSNCISLESIVIPNSVIKIGESAFFNCTSLTSITIPNSVIKIGKSAFLNCTSLNSIKIPVSVKYIGADAFKGCTELKDIFYSGSKKEWNKIEYFYNIPNYVKIHFECDNEENKEEVINNSDIEKEVIRLLSKGVSEKGILSTLQSKGFKDKDIVNSISNINPSSSMVSSFCDKVILPKVIDLLNQTSQGVSKYSVGEVARLLYKNYPENLVNKTIVSILDEQHLVD